MPNVTVLTFAIGKHAAAAVHRQIADTAASLATETSLESPRQFEHLLRRFPDYFDAEIRTAPPGPIRLNWRAHAYGAGVLLLAQNDTLRSINLLLSGADADCDDLAMNQAAALLTPIPNYARCFGIIEKATRPLIATFCDAQGGITRPVEQTLYAFAAAFFALSESAHAGA